MSVTAFRRRHEQPVEPDLVNPDEFMTMAKLAKYLGYERGNRPDKSAYAFVMRKGIPTESRDRTLVVRKGDVDRATKASSRRLESLAESISRSRRR